jgi:hypothetical protein
LAETLIFGRLYRQKLAHFTDVTATPHEGATRYQGAHRSTDSI